MTTGATPSGAPALGPGDGTLLGARLGRDAIQFALAAPHATAVDLCLFDAAGQRETARLRMPEPQNGVWSGALPLGPGIGAGLVYGWRVHGPWSPHEGHRFNPAKLLLDPAARAVLGRYTGDDLYLGHDPRSPSGDLPDLRDNAATALKARVVADLPQPSAPRPLPEPARRVIYELHVKGFTALHPEVPASQRGRYAGLAHPAVLAHLQSLGVTTVCLMPVAHRADEARLQALGLSNYWGYSPIAWSAPETRYASEGPDSDARSEFRAMVEALHGGGFEVVLDVVYNHTAELDEWGPTLSLRGIDNALYYHLLPHKRSAYANWTGCGNCVNFDQPLVRRTVLESLRRWVVEFGVDGFRFDLAPVLARGGEDVQGRFRPDAPLLQAIASDPVLGQRLMIAEPWDIGAGGYQLGAFPPGWLEWNDRYRDTQRRFWLHRLSSRGAFANRLAGSSDVFGHAGRGPHSSVNFITAHDGFTLRDLVSYADRHNQANGEDNRDGHADNLSTNNGVEGETDAPSVLDRRARQQRVLLATLVLSLGTPMLLAGDEFGHSQGGNNNAYCQDNPTTWLNWTRADRSLCAFVQAVLALRQELPVLQASHWWQTGASDQGPEAVWWTASGQPMSASAWDEPHSQALSLRLQGAGQGAGQGVLLLFNPESNPVCFTLPPGAWRLRLDTAVADPSAPAAEGRWLRPTEDVVPGALWMAEAEAEALAVAESNPV